MDTITLSALILGKITFLYVALCGAKRQTGAQAGRFRSRASLGKMRPILIVQSAVIFLCTKISRIY